MASAFVTCSALGDQVTAAVTAMTPVQRNALCAALSCTPTVSAITAALLGLPGAGTPGYVLTMVGAVPTWAAPSAGSGPLSQANTIVSLNTLAGAGNSGYQLELAGATPTWTAPVLKETATAVAVSLRPVVVAGVRTFTTVTHDAVFGATFGSWDAGKSIFTFSRAGAYHITGFGSVVAQVTASGAAGSQGSVNCDLVVDGVTYIMNGVNFDTGPGCIVFPSGSGSMTIALPNIVVGSTARLVAATNAPAAGAAYNAWFGLSGTAQGGGNAASGLSISNW